MPLISLCQLSFPDTPPQTDLDIARDLGVAGVSVAENKVPPGEETELGELFRSAGLEIPFGVPTVWTILPPLGGTFSPLPADPAERIESIAASIGVLGRLGAPSVMVCTGPAGDRSDSDARRIVVDGLRHLAAVAASEGTSLSLEPMREPFKPIRTIVSSLAETLDLLDEVGADVGIVFDLWHMWDSLDVASLLPEALPRIHAVQVADYRQPTRGPQDRVVAGDGVADIPGMLALLRSLEYSGWYDLEVFSDDGRFGAAYDDSLWKLPPAEFAELQLRGFQRCWAESEHR